MLEKVEGNRRREQEAAWLSIKKKTTNLTENYRPIKNQYLGKSQKESASNEFAST